MTYAAFFRDCMPVWALGKVMSSSVDKKNRRITGGGFDRGMPPEGSSVLIFVFPVHSDPRGRDRSRLTGFGVKIMQTYEDLNYNLKLTATNA
jgi:hypothetical protein